MNGTYRYSNAQYAKIGNAYVVAFVDTYDDNGKCVYGTEIFSSSFDVKDILLTAQIQSNGGYTDDVMDGMSLELEEWARAYRYYRYVDDTTYVDADKDKTYNDYAITKENEEDIYTYAPLAKVHAQYQAQNKKLQESSFAGEITYLKSEYSLDLSSSDTAMSSRFAAGYLETLKASHKAWREKEKCYTSNELNGDGSPDALGFLTWWVDGGTDNDSQYIKGLLVYTTTEKVLYQSSLRMVGGAAYTSSGKQFTYATLDIFSIE
jgi:hypothetical protein